MMSASSIISLSEMMLPAACTPLSVRAHLTSADFLGSLAFALEIAPASTKALKRSPSIVFSLLLLREGQSLDCLLVQDIIG